MISSNNFTLDDDEELECLPAPHLTLAPAAEVELQHPLPPRATSPLALQSSIGGSPGSLSIQLRDPPKSYIDADLGVSTLAQVSQVLHDNQQRIEGLESQLQDLLRRHARLVAAERLLEQQKVIDAFAIGTELGYDAGRPIASLLVYRCCLRWGCFGSDVQAAAILKHFSTMLLVATDEDAILARHTAAAVLARAASSSGGDGVQGLAVAADTGAQIEHSVLAAATREVSYWLAVTSTLLALVDPHLPLSALMGTARLAAPGVGASAAASSPAGHAHLGAAAASAHLVAVAGDARATMARAASAAAAKVQEIQRRMGTTFSGMQLVGKNLLMRGRRGRAEGPGAAAAMESRAVSGGGDAVSDGGTLEQQQQQQALQGSSEAAVGREGSDEFPLPSFPPAGGGSISRSSSPCPSATTSGSGTEPPHQVPAAATGPSPVIPRSRIFSMHPTGSQTAFRQHLDVVVQRTYMQMRDTLKRNVSALLPNCVQHPLQLASSSSYSSPPPLGGVEAALVAGGEAEQQQRQQEGDGAAPGRTAEGSTGGAAPQCASPPTLSPCPSRDVSPLQPWWDLVGQLSLHLEQLRAAHVPRILIRCLFKQTLSFIDVQLFNQMLLRPECCSISNARYLVAGLQLLEAWLRGSAAISTGPGPAVRAEGAGPAPTAVVATGEDLAVLVDNLKHIRQAAHFLVLANKGALRLDDFIAMCPDLNVQQLYRLATTFWDDSPMPPPPPPAQTWMSVDASASAAATAPKLPSVGVPEPEAEADAGGSDDRRIGELLAQSLPNEVEPARPSALDSSSSAVAEEGADLDGDPKDEARHQAETQAQGGITQESPRVQADQQEKEEGAQVKLQLGSVAAGQLSAGDGGGGVTFGRIVSGEVLEEMKRRHCVANNGGLIVTFLLDEDSTPLIVHSLGLGESGGGGAGGYGAVVVARELLQVINEPRLHEGLTQGLPPALCGEDCPPHVFAFMLDGVTGPGPHCSSG